MIPKLFETLAKVLLAPNVLINRLTGHSFGCNWHVLHSLHCIVYAACVCDAYLAVGWVIRQCGTGGLISSISHCLDTNHNCDIVPEFSTTEEHSFLRSIFL